MKTLTVSLADIEGVPHSSSLAGTNVQVSARYTSALTLTDGRIVPAVIKTRQLPTSGDATFEVWASDDTDVRSEDRGFAIIVTARLSGKGGKSLGTYTRTVKPLMATTSPVSLGKLAAAEPVPAQWVSVGELVDDVNAAKVAAQAAQADATSAADRAEAAENNVAAAAVPALNAAIAAGSEGTPPVTETRANLAQDPQGGHGLGWTVNTTSFTTGESTTVTRRPGGKSMATTRTAAASSTISQFSYMGQSGAGAPGRLSVAPGATYTLTVYTVSSRSARSRLATTFYDSGGAIVGAPVNGEWAETVPHAGSNSSFMRLVQTVTAPAGSATIAVIGQTYPRTGDPASVEGEQGWWQDFLMEESPTVKDYFDGSTAGAANVTYAWTGAPHASTSTRVEVLEPGTPGINIEAPQAGAALADRVLIEWTNAEAWQPLTIARTASGLVSTASVRWPDGSGGTFTRTAGADAVDAYTITHTASGKKVTQPAVIRNAAGDVTTKPALTVGVI